MYGHLQERERGCKHTWLWLKLLEIGLKTPSNSLSGFCHNNNNQLTPKRPQISPKLIFRLFSTSRKSHYWSWSPLRRFCWTHSPPSERRKGLCSASRGGRKFFPSHKHSRCEPPCFSWRLFIELWELREGDNLGKIKPVRWRKQLWPHHVTPVFGIMFHHWENWALKPSNIRTSAWSYSALWFFFWSNIWRWNNLSSEAEQQHSLKQHSSKCFN